MNCNAGTLQTSVLPKLTNLQVSFYKTRMRANKRLPNGSRTTRRNARLSRVLVRKKFISNGILNSKAHT